MSYSHEWLIENRVLYSRIWGAHTDDDVVISSNELAGYFEASPNPVYLIIDALDMTSFPHNVVRAATSVQKFMAHRNMRQLIMISSNPAVSFVTMLATKVRSSQVVLHKSLDEALAYVAKQVPDVAAQMKKPTA